MTRRKITDEAEEQVEEEEQESQTPDDAEEYREQLTQRMPTALVDRVDEFKDKYGMSRNSAINLLVREALEDR